MIYFLYDLFYIFPLSVAVFLSGLPYFGTGDLALPGSIFSIVLIVVLLLLRHCGKKERFLILGIVVVSILGLLFVLGPERRAAAYEKYSWLLWVMAVVAVCIVLGRLAQKFLWMKISLSVILFSNLLYIMLSGKDVSRFTAPIVFLVMLIYILEIIQTYWEKSGYVYTKNHVAILAPILLALIILVNFAPAPDDPYDWKIARNIWKMTVTEYKRIVGIFKADDEEYTYAGFSDEGVVSGSVSSENVREVLAVRTDEKSWDKLYLEGMAFENFDGKEWTNDSDTIEDFRGFDMLETRIVIRNFEDSYEREFIKEGRVEIESRLFNTKYLFLPTKSNLESRNTSLPDYRENERQLLADSKIKYGDTYNITYYSLNFANPDLPLLIDNAEPVTEEKWNDMVRRAGLGEFKQYSFSNYQKYRQAVFDKYSCKNGVSQEVAALVDDITGACEGDFEKLTAIDRYLQEFEYNRHPGKLPDTIKNSSDYLDYFLLESREGFCVHYATAFTILARECGFPARYVQGYYVTRKNGDISTVTEKNAHAWSEVYFDNFGWVVFEATPGYSVSKGWAVQGKSSADMSDYYNRYGEMENDVDSFENVVIEEEKKPFDINIVLIPVFCTIVFGFVYVFVVRLVSDRKYRSMNLSQKVEYLVNSNLKLLKKMGYSLKDNDTVSEYQRMTIDSLKGREDLEENEKTRLIDALSFLPVYEALLYSDYRADGEDVTLLENSGQTFKQQLRKKLIYRLFIW